MELILKYFPQLTETQKAQFGKLDALYRDWNSRINVISRKDIDGLYEKHVLHSLSIAALFAFNPGTRIIDVGTGGGFPGIPLAIFFPEVRFHLVDSIAKKIQVVKAVSSELGLNNLTSEQARAEQLKKSTFDFALSRAVAPLQELWTWTKPLLRRQPAGGRPTPLQEGERNVQPPGLICLKGGNLQVEIRESNTKPQVLDISKIFHEPFFQEKFLLYLPLQA